jgi:hypothetical protein
LLAGRGMSDLSKIMYLEVIDATFSIDGVIGAFAFTLSIPLILIGNGVGAFVVREMTVKNVENVKKYVYLKNGGMYSILFLGAIMLLDSFGYRSQLGFAGNNFSSTRLFLLEVTRSSQKQFKCGLNK